MVNDLLDETLSLQSPHGLSGHGSVDLHSLDQDGLRDHLVSRDFLEDLVAARKDEKSGRREAVGRNSLGGLVNHDGVVGLVLHLSLGPLLLLTVERSRGEFLSNGSPETQKPGRATPSRAPQRHLSRSIPDTTLVSPLLDLTHSSIDNRHSPGLGTSRGGEGDLGLGLGRLSCG